MYHNNGDRYEGDFKNDFLIMVIDMKEIGKMI